MLAYCHKPRILFLKNQFNLFQISRTLAASSTSEGETHKYEPKYHDFTVKYLIKTLGLSLEIANSTSLRVKILSLQKSDSVIALLRAHGFENAQISRIITIVPKLLVINPDEITLPKLSFLSSVGITNEVIVTNPHLLVHSLDNKLIPCYNFFKNMALSEKQIVGISNRLPWSFASHLQHCIASNVKLLKEIGVAQKYISSLVYRRPRMVNTPIDRFKKLVEGVLELKFDPLKRTFVTALEIKYATTKLMWEHRIEVYKRWGWSEQDVLLAFQKFPGCMSTSEKKVMSLMDFLVNKMGFQSIAISRRPVVFSLSLELRIIPRCSVISVLQKKGMINEDLSLLPFTFLIHSDKQFLDKFITKYQEQVPELLSVYKGKLVKFPPK